jgi:hypothetical protein
MKNELGHAACAEMSIASGSSPGRADAEKNVIIS